MSTLSGLLDAVLAGPRWKWKALFLVLVFALLRAFPSYEALKTPFVESTWEHTFLQIDNLIFDMGQFFPPGSHESKMTFRLTVPLLARALELGETDMLVLSAISGVALLWVALVLGYKITRSKEVALFSCLAIACAWAGQTGFHELRGGFYDALALLLLLLAMAADSPVIAAVCVFLAAWTDERAIIASTFVFLLSSKSLRAASVGEPTTPASLTNSERRKTIALAIAFAGYGILRLWMTAHYSLVVATGNVGFDVLAQQSRLIPLAIWSGLAGCWIIVASGIVSAVRQHRYVFAAIFCALIAVTITSALMVLDVTRSMAYCLPAAFVALYLLKDAVNLKRLALMSAVASFLLPSWYVQGNAAIWYIIPLPVQLVRWLSPH